MFRKNKSRNGDELWKTTPTQRNSPQKAKKEPKRCSEIFLKFGVWSGAKCVDLVDDPIKKNAAKWILTCKTRFNCSREWASERYIAIPTSIWTALQDLCWSGSWGLIEIWGGFLPICVSICPSSNAKNGFLPISVSCKRSEFWTDSVAVVSEPW